MVLISEIKFWKKKYKKMDPIYPCKQVVMQDHVMLKRKKVAKTPFFFLLKRKKKNDHTKFKISFSFTWMD